MSEPQAPRPRGAGGYELLEIVGRGGMGEVWKARDPKLGRTVAVKFLDRAGRDERARFAREARIAAQLDHPAIARPYEYVEDAQDPMIVFQFVEGETLDASPRPLRDKVRALGEAARGLHHAHLRGVIHRDVKPRNIMIDPAGRGYVLDFGLARTPAAADATALTVPGAVLGTPAFLSPEAAAGNPDQLDARADVWGLGMCLYYALEGRAPFTGAAWDLVPRILDEPIPPPGGPRELRAICMKALEKDPGRRYRSAEEFARELELWLAGDLPLAALPQERMTRRIRRAVHWTRRRVGLLVAMGASALVPIAIFLVVGTHDPIESEPAPAGWTVVEGSPRWAVAPRPVTHHDYARFLAATGNRRMFVPDPYLEDGVPEDDEPIRDLSTVHSRMYALWKGAWLAPHDVAARVGHAASEPVLGRILLRARSPSALEGFLSHDDPAVRAEALRLWLPRAAPEEARRAAEAVILRGGEWEELNVAVGWIADQGPGAQTEAGVTHVRAEFLAAWSGDASALGRLRWLAYSDDGPLAAAASEALLWLESGVNARVFEQAPEAVRAAYERRFGRPP